MNADGSGQPLVLRGHEKEALRLMRAWTENQRRLIGEAARFALVFHGGSGSTVEEIRDLLKK